MMHNHVRVDWGAKQSVPDHVDRRNLISNNAVLKGADVKHMHLNKEVPTGLHNRGGSCMFSGKSTTLGACPNCFYTKAESTGNKEEELEVCVQLLGYDFMGSPRPMQKSRARNTCPQWRKIRLGNI